MRIGVRVVVQGRRYFPGRKILVPGHKDLIDRKVRFGGGPILHTPYAVRSDTVRWVEQVLPSVLKTPSLWVASKTDSTTLGESTTPKISPATDTIRSMDVIHLWEVGSDEQGGKYRDDVTVTIDSWSNATFFSSSLSGEKRILRAICGLAIRTWAGRCRRKDRWVEARDQGGRRRFARGCSRLAR